MSRSEPLQNESVPMAGQKRKAESQESLEINLDAPEPPSKKALRKAKKAKLSSSESAGPRLSKKIQTSTTQLSTKARSNHGIWIGNLAFTTSKDDLQSFLSSDETNPIQADQILRINLPMGKAANGRSQNKGFAYIDFGSAAALQNALQLSEKLLGGRRVLIKNAQDFQGRPERGANEVQRAVPSSRRIFVGNLTFDTTNEDLKAHFEACGAVSNVHMATFEDSGKCKGFAWIEFEQISSAECAMRGWIEVNDRLDAELGQKAVKRRKWIGTIGGRKLRMEYAEDKTTRYNKRFGKQAAGQRDGPESEIGITELSPPAALSEVAAGAFPRTPRLSNQTPSGGYAASTVTRLTGAIVSGEGKKIMFD